MVNNKEWKIGNTVKIGFMRLRIVSVRAIRDGMPDIYTLENIDGTKHYEFIPHHGIKKL